ncbi:DUF6264 family protein [Mycolicibacterium neoaurum]|uniref:DUF6264 family protein n=1 Tax=Mycolicibacterium neoaurum TaxID=1795 RepID=UPI0034D79B42
MTGAGPGGPSYPAMSYGSWSTPPPTGTAHGPRRNVVDVVVSIGLMGVHLLVAMATLMMIGFAAMGMDSCSYRACGDPIWADISLGIVLISAVSLPAADVVLTIVWLVRNRRSWPIPLAFCAAHLVLGAVCLALFLASGPQ